MYNRLLRAKDVSTAYLKVREECVKGGDHAVKKAQVFARRRDTIVEGFYAGC